MVMNSTITYAVNGKQYVMVFSGEGQSVSAGPHSLTQKSMLLHADQRACFDTIVRDGKGQMPAWAGMIADEEIDQIWAYIRSRAEN
jgi:hypothetical protein